MVEFYFIIAEKVKSFFTLKGMINGYFEASLSFDYEIYLNVS